jgi:tetratricopeptide (TPR) repeat protein
MLAIAIWSTYGTLRRVPQLTEKDSVVLADFTNQTGDAVFDGALRQGLSFELEQSPFAVISDSRVQQLLPRMGQPKGARVTPELAQQICERTASAMVLDGSIARLGSQYVLGLRAMNCTGAILDQQQIQFTRQEDVLDALSQVTRRFRTRVGESLASIEKQSTLPEATTSSIETLKAYDAGSRAGLYSGITEGIPFYRRAVELDPEFAMAHARLGLAYNSLGNTVLSAEHTRKAWLLRDRVSDRERFYIDFTYDRQVTGNLEKAYQTLELWYQTYPRAEQPNPRGLFGGVSTHGTGRYERAIEAAREGLADDPEFGMGYGNLAGSYFLTGRFAEAEKTIQTAFERKVVFDRLLAIHYNVAVLKGDQEQMDRAVAMARGRRGVEHWLTHAQALSFARAGRLRDAARLSIRAVDLAMQAGDLERAACYQAARATWEALAGNAGEATRNATAALERSDGREVQYAAALALGLSRSSARSDAIAADLEQRFPEDTFVKFTYVPVLRGLAELARGRAEGSVERLQVALAYEHAANGLNFLNYYLGGLHSAYVRGEALSATKRYADAAAEFQKILDNPGLVGTDPIGVLVHLQLGRVFALSGDTSKAKAAYETFLALWKDADPDVPILKSARAEYARL